MKDHFKHRKIYGTFHLRQRINRDSIHISKRSQTLKCEMLLMTLSCLADRSDLIQPIESTAARGAEGGGDEERVEPVLDVLHHGLLQPVPPQNTLVVGLEDPQLDKSNHGGFLHTRMSFLCMKTNLVFITFLALLIVIKRREDWY